MGQHPYAHIATLADVASTSQSLGRRLLLNIGSESNPDIWGTFRMLFGQILANEGMLVRAMNAEIEGLGDVAKVFGTHEDTTRETNPWLILEFFLYVHEGLDNRSPRVAWSVNDGSDRARVLRLAKLYGNQGGM